MTVLWAQLKARIEQACLRTGNHFPWWLAVWTTTATMVVAFVSFLQRGPHLASILALALAYLPVAWWTVTARLLPMTVEATVTVAAVLLFLTQPVNPDLAPFVLMILVAEVAATTAWPFAAGVGVVSAAVFVGAEQLGHLHTLALYVVGLVLGFDVGLTIRWYMRALEAERAKTEGARREARSDERRRIAREVHDVVGHSLSITLLHVTAARHALQKHGDVADALESLTEAEQVGRTAMADVRRSVAVFGTDESPLAPQPGLADIAGLVDSSRAAGLDVRYDGATGLTTTDVAGLELYRIVQESLANVAKHAPTSAVRIELAECVQGLRLSVRNTLPAEAPAHSTDGLGLPGMADRARQMGGELHAGVDGEHWLVDVVVPARA